MRKSLLGALFGLLAGSVLGTVLAVSVYYFDSSAQRDRGWATYPKLADIVIPQVQQTIITGTPLSYLLFQAILLAGGFGSVVGASAAGTAAILRATGQTK